MKHANDALQGYTCTENYYQHLSKNDLYTDGVKALCDKFQCWWFLDVVMSYRNELKQHDFQVWKLVRTQHSAVVKCEDGDGKVLVRQEVEFTDFEPETATIWREGDVVLLPSEH